MTLYGFVDRIEGDMCAVCLADEACGHDCAACAGCSRKTNGRIIMALHDGAVRQGDRVVIHAPEKTVLAASFVVFLLPVALTVLGYAAGKYVLNGWYFALIGALLGLTLGITACKLYSARLSGQAATVYRVQAVLLPEEDA